MAKRLLKDREHRQQAVSCDRQQAATRGFHANSLLSPSSRRYRQPCKAVGGVEGVDGRWACLPGARLAGAGADGYYSERDTEYSAERGSTRRSSLFSHPPLSSNSMPLRTNYYTRSSTCFFSNLIVRSGVLCRPHRSAHSGLNDQPRAG